MDPLNFERCECCGEKEPEALPAAGAFLWPGQTTEPRLACFGHVLKAAHVADAMGFVLHVIPLAQEVARRKAAAVELGKQVADKIRGVTREQADVAIVFDGEEAVFEDCKIEYQKARP